MATQYDLQTPKKSEDAGVTLVEFLRFISTLLRYWPIMVISMGVMFAAALAYNRYAQNIYRLQTVVAVEEFENPLATGESALDVAFSLGGTGILDTRKAILTSHAHNYEVAKHLNWEVRYFTSGSLTGREVYDDEFYFVEFDKSHPQVIGMNFKLTFEEDGFKIETVPTASRVKTVNYETLEIIN